MSLTQADEIYEKYVRPLPRSERLRLLERTAHDLAEADESTERQVSHSILELRGLGKELWAGIDPKQYIDELRNDWDRQAGGSVP